MKLPVDLFDKSKSKNIKNLTPKKTLFYFVTVFLLVIAGTQLLLNSLVSQISLILIIGILAIYLLNGIFKSFKLSSNLLIFLLITITIFALYSTVLQFTLLLWLYVLPLLIFLMLDRLEALIWVLVLFASLLILILILTTGLIEVQIDSLTLLQMVATLSLVTGLTYFITYVNDLTSVKPVATLDKAIHELQNEKTKMFEQREKLRIILESIGDGVLVMDNQRRIALINKTTEKITGYTKRELMGQNFSQILRLVSDNKDRRLYFNLITEIYENGFLSSGADSAYLIRKSGDKVPVSFSASPIKSLGGKVIGCVLVFRDTTKEQEIDRMKSEFVSIASHQLRTPLTGIRWYSELLAANEDKNLSKEQVGFIKSIEESTNRMIELVNDLLDVSRIDMGRKFLIEKDKVDVIPLISQVIKDQSVAARSKEIKITISKSLPKSMMLEIDGKKIAQVFYNLISNAIKYSPEKSEVIVDYDENSQNVVFSVRDNGVGIPLEDQGQIFTKFFRADNVSDGRFEGTGLGLYIVKAIVEGHGGKVWFVSKPGEGTTFFVELPKI